MKNFFLIIAAVLFTSNLFSQQHSFFVKGRVVDATTKSPLQGTSVFAENTTLGTATDQDGNFLLELPLGGYALVISYTGFNTQSIRVSHTESNSLQVEMTIKEKAMEEVAIVSTGEVKNGFEKYGQFFLDEFIGKSNNSILCKLKNPEVLRFYFSRKKNRLKVLANEPLVIENNALGYNIKYEIDSFVHEYKSDLSVYTGYPLFEEMSATSAEQKATWATARENAYRGSVLHFMKSLYNMELEEEGFEIQFIININGKDSALRLKDYYEAINFQQEDSTLPVQIKPNQTQVGVIYTKQKPEEGYLKENKNVPTDFQFSTINFLPNKPLFIERNGFYFEQNDLIINDYWEWNKMADTLPYDYK